MIGGLLNKRMVERVAVAEARAATAELILKNMQNSARLVGIETEGRELRLAFIRNGNPYVITTYRTMDLDIQAMRRDLLAVPE